MAKARGKGEERAAGSKGGGKGRGSGPVPTVRPGQQPATGPGAAALALLAGKWSGAQGETYDVSERDWSCSRTESTGASRKYHLTWNEKKSAVFWGERFCLYAEDITRDKPARWYRTDDPVKARVAFTWRRPAGARTGGGAAAGAAAGGAPTRRVAPSAAASAAGGAMKAAAAPGVGSPGWAARVSAAARQSVAGARVAAQAASLQAAGDWSEADPEEREDAEELSRADLFLERLAAEAPGAKPSTGKGAEALARLLGDWWGPKGELFRVGQHWACEFLGPRKAQARRVDLAWDAWSGCVLLGRAYELEVPPEDQISELRWRAQTPNKGSEKQADDGQDAAPLPPLLWARHEEEGEQ
eukprot:TRINITY_DN47219_c0_g1_i1.p1 TRINITY_DN47219_c0_g1~~TRINITY_DN47219_c0_g1_i1.p1  ORF type:complete len:357 (-),score=78.87 TRINITY_DN47219_c0_g1_i1:62-1132(-)